MEEVGFGTIGLEGAVHRILGILLLTASIPAAAQVPTVSGEQRESPFAEGIILTQLQSAFIHGTIDVVVSTKDGFVLATDSRATSDGSYSDDARKLFAIGNRAACVVAGVIGSDIHMEGFRLRDAIGTHLVVLEQQVSRENRPASATDIARTFSLGFHGVVGLLVPGGQGRPIVVGGISAVSVSPEGQPEWITFYLPVDMRADEAGTEYFSTGLPIYLYHPQVLGLRFGIQALGFPNIVEQLVEAAGPTRDAFSTSPIMKRFYERKRQGRLDEFTLREGIQLAKGLVAATIASAPAQAGVGGPIDILTVTKDGVRWVQRKEQIAPFAPPFHSRIFRLESIGGQQRLDGFECIRCTFQDTSFSYAGDGDVELLAPRIEGHCRLTLQSGARRKMPTVVDRLTRTLAGRCEITEIP